jgi:hypothetical protein
MHAYCTADIWAGSDWSTRINGRWWTQHLSRFLNALNSWIGTSLSSSKIGEIHEHWIVKGTSTCKAERRRRKSISSPLVRAVIRMYVAHNCWTTQTQRMGLTHIRHTPRVESLKWDEMKKLWMPALRWVSSYFCACYIAAYWKGDVYVSAAREWWVLSGVFLVVRDGWTGSSGLFQWRVRAYRSYGHLQFIHSYIQYDLTRPTASSAEIGVLLGYRATMIWKNYFLMWTKIRVVAW